MTLTTEDRPTTLVLIAWDTRDAADYLARFPLPGRILTVTRRSPHAVRGCIADGVVATPRMHDCPTALDEILPAVLPCLIGGRSGR